MLDPQALKQLLHESEYTQLEKLQFCLAVDVDKPKSVSDIRSLATSAGLNAVGKWNVSSILSGSKGRAIRTPLGWELSPQGRIKVSKLIGSLATGQPPKIAASLRKHLGTVTDPTTEAFLAEAIECYERGLHRAAVVLSWVGALSVLQEFVIQNHLADFNKEATRRNSSWKAAKTRDDLSRMKEHEFLQVIDSISVIGKSVRQELEKRLQLRNGCGHPNSLKIADNSVAAHIEVLILNVFSQFPI